MRILYFHQYFATPEAAGGIRSYQMARRLIGRGHEVTMVCGNEDVLEGEFKNGRRQGNIQGIDVIELDLPYSNYYGFLQRSIVFLRFAWRSITIALTEDYDLVFATSTPLTVGIPGIIARYLRNKPFVFEVRDLWPELPREMGVVKNPVVLTAMSCLEWLSYHSAHGCIGLSPGIVNGIKRRGVQDNKIAMIPNGCDLDLFEIEETDSIHSPFVEKDDLLAVFTGAHGIANGLDAVLDAAIELKKRNRKDIKLLFIGEGKLKPTLKQRVAEAGLDNCAFLDPVPKRELVSIMKEADVGLMVLENIPAFYYGTSPNKFFDYIAAGLPVLNNYPGWLAELIQDNHCGLVVPPRDSVAFADALEYMADHRKELMEMGRNSRRLAEREFDRNEHANEFSTFLESKVLTVKT